ncbi:DUF262 domain-containing protein [Labrys monachus]|uniref:GmrSD restriction endonucleases N-terminal domain-containing protein n=1 Tax=Labrys monachus TaxID=217067 RepID=A0ABU0FMG8_9HYPH|nr:DUF262 domain-containing protein [Labrys monachus]MDQ0395786.1 hypothetical protein [Labrys monachus]
MLPLEKLISSFREAQSKLVVQTADLPLATLAQMVEDNAIDLQPGFQRRERWSPDKQSALIESFLLNVPVPPVYLAEELSGTYTAIDGKQRLRAISDFIFGRLTLRNLERLTEAQGLKFDDLPSEITNSFRLRPYLRVVTLLKQTDPMLKYEVFLRLNRGGEALNAQEIRNVAFRGPLNDRIYTLSENQFLRQRLKIDGHKSAAYREMDDAEYVLRFLTLSERIAIFSGSLVKEMDEYMRRHQLDSGLKVENLAATFNQAMDRCQAIWGDYAFRRPEGQGWRDQTLAGMYDAQMISASQISQQVADKAANHQAAVQGQTRALFDEAEFDKSVRTGTNTPARIRYRVNRMKRLLEAI